MEEIKKSGLTLAEAQTITNAYMADVKNGFIGTGYSLKIIRDEKLWQEKYESFDAFMSGEYEKDKSWASKCISVYETFGEITQLGELPKLADAYTGYNVGQLIELVSLPEEKWEAVTPKTTIREIREMKPKRNKKVATVATFEKKDEVDQESLSAYGTPKTIRPEDSLLSTPGCEGGHDCFNCHVECGIRQKYCYCVEAPMGNPFPCVTLELIENLKGEMGERCQFVDNSLANHRTVVKEPVPCCKNCADPCKYACERAGKCKEVAISQKEQEPEQEISSESDTCPPNNSSCRRQEWGTDPEAQKRGREDCKKCWQDAKKLQTVVEKVEEPREPEPMEEAEEEAVYCFTAGRCGANDGAYGVTWATIVKAYLDKLHDNGTAPISGDIPAITVEAMGHECLVEPGYDAEFWKDDRLWFKVEWQRLQNEYEWFYPEKPVEEPQEPLAKAPEPEAPEPEAPEPEAPVVIDAEYTEVPEPLEEEYTLDFFLKEQNQKLEEFLKVEGVPCIVLERQKYIVAALAAMKTDLEIEEFKRTYKPEQPELPILKNNDQRGAFVDAYETWPLWIETKETGEQYYKYDLPDGTSMVVKVYHAKLFDYKASPGTKYEERFREGYGRQEYYLVREGKFFKDCDVNRSYLIDKLKEIQRKDK